MHAEDPGDRTGRPVLEQIERLQVAPQGIVPSSMCPVDFAKPVIDMSVVIVVVVREVAERPSGIPFGSR